MPKNVTVVRKDNKNLHFYLKEINFNKNLKQLKTELANKKILIYGAGLLFETAFKHYDFDGLNIIGISDKKYENEDSPNEFLGLKTFSPEQINNLEVDCILISMQEYQNLIKTFMIKYPKIQILPLFKSKPISTFRRRNINHNIFVEKKGLHEKKIKKLSNFEHKYIAIKQELKHRLGLLEIPQIEFNLTTKCTLKCKHCSNYIPYLKENEHCSISIDEFKKQIDNLLKAVHKVKNLLLLGGEPLLVKNLDEYLEYACSKKKIERVWIVTNGTLLLKENLIKTAKKYKEKTTIWLSNYSKNEELKTKIKHDEILKQINNAGLDYDYVQDLTWGFTSELNYNPIRNNEKEYFEYCKNNCVAVFEGKIYICPRAGVFSLKGIYTPKTDEVIDLNIEDNARILKKKLIEFYSRDYFTACNYCTILEDKSKDRILPAIQQ